MKTVFRIIDDSFVRGAVYALLLRYTMQEYTKPDSHIMNWAPALLLAIAIAVWEVWRARE